MKCICLFEEEQRVIVSYMSLISIHMQFFISPARVCDELCEENCSEPLRQL
jgi:hypothetical protein